MKTVPNNQNAFLVGATGTGKRVLATQRIIDNLADGRAVVLFDCGPSYRTLVQALGGTVVHHAAQKFGILPLTVIDLEDLPNPVPLEQLNVPELTANTFVLIDEPLKVARHISDLWPQLKSAVARGVRVCVVVQNLEDVAAEDRPEGMTVLTVKDHALVVDGQWQPNQLCRHQDGGIYRYLFRSKHTEDLAELVNYEHIWPFEPGAKWSRPAHEWAGRFTPITAADLAEAQKVDRETAQAAIATAKAARRASAK